MSRYLLKITLIALLLSAFAVPQVALAADELLPDFNPICWTLRDCRNVRQNWQEGVSTAPGNGFAPNESPCVGSRGGSEDPNEQWGRCLPAGNVETQIFFAGRRNFTNAGDFIVTIYNYLLGIVGIVAVVVIMVAGLQWLTSGGNSESIKRAQQRIGGALIGMVLAFSSYFILNAINPWLVNLRLPQTWLLKSQILMPEFCRDVRGVEAGGILLAEAGDSENNFTPTQAPTDPTKFNLALSPTNLSALKCNKEYFVSGAAGNTCQGHFCDNDNLCMPSARVKNSYECIDAIIAGRLYDSSFFEPDCTSIGVEGWSYPYISSVDGSQVKAVCGGGLQYVEPGGGVAINRMEIDADTKKVIYYVPRSSLDTLKKRAADCEDNGGFKGFVLSLAMREACWFDTSEFHYVGRSGQDLGIRSLSPSRVGEFNPQEVDSRDLISLTEIERGLLLNIDVAQIRDVD